MHVIVVIVLQLPDGLATNYSKGGDALQNKYILLYYHVKDPTKVIVRSIDKPYVMQRTLDELRQSFDIVIIYWFREDLKKGIDLNYARRMARQWKTEADELEDALFSKEWITKILNEVWKILVLLKQRGGDAVEWEVSTCGAHAPRVLKRLRPVNAVVNS